MNYKVNDVVYLDRPDCEWILKIDGVCYDTKTFTLQDAIVKLKPPSLSNDKHADDYSLGGEEDSVYDDRDIEEDDDRDMDNELDLLDDEDQPVVYTWERLLDTVPVNYKIRRDSFPLSFITSYATPEQFDLYMDILGGWNTSFYTEARKRSKTPRTFETD